MEILKRISSESIRINSSEKGTVILFPKILSYNQHLRGLQKSVRMLILHIYSIKYLKFA